MSDILDEIIKDLHRREMKGLVEYGKTLSDAPLTEIETLSHLYEEILDSAFYIKKIIQIKQKTNASNPTR